MKIEKIIISRGRKYSINFQSYDYHVGLEVSEIEDVNQAHKEIDNIISNMEQLEAKRILEEIERKRKKK